MADTGANVCMSPYTDALMDVHNIPPVPVGLAVETNNTQDIAYCKQMGYLPIPRLDNTIHLQPVLSNADATDFIISPEAILQASDDFYMYTQKGYKDDCTGHLTFGDTTAQFCYDYH